MNFITAVFFGLIVLVFPLFLYLCFKFATYGFYRGKHIAKDSKIQNRENSQKEKGVKES